MAAPPPPAAARPPRVPRPPRVITPPSTSAPPPSLPLPATAVLPIPKIDAGLTRIRMILYNSLRIPTAEVMPLSDIAQYALQNYALFVWLVTHRQPDYNDGPTAAEVTGMVANGTTLLNKLEANGPSSIYLALNGGYTDTPLAASATERLILLALIAERPQLIPRILRIFPESQDPIRLAALLQPWTNPYLDTYAPSYADPASRDVTTREMTTVLSSLPATGLLRALASMGRLRIMHNLMLRDAVRVRYALATVIADPHIFSPPSLGEAEALLTNIETTILANRDLYIPLNLAILTLRNNFNKVKGVLAVGTAITQDAVRRLRLILGVVNASDALFDKLAPK